MYDLKLDYHYGNNADSYSFYRIPKLLFTDNRFAKLSIEAKLLYGIMLDRMALSIKNNWLDNLNRVYIYFTVEDASEMLSIGNTKMIRIFAELDTVKGIGLIERKKQGQGKPTIIYVKNFSTLAFEGTDKAQEHKKYPKPNFKTCENETSEPVKVEENQEKTADFEQNPTVLGADNQNIQVNTFTFETSRHSDYECADIQDMNTNNTKKNNTEFNDTQSIYPQTPYEQNSETEKDGLMDRISDEDLEDLVLEDLYNQKTLPYEYTADERKMRKAIHTLTEFEHYQEQLKNGNSDFYFSALNLFCEALTEMLTTKQNMTLKGSYVTYAKVYDKLLPYLSFETTYGSIYDLQETAISDFTTACSEQRIKNHLAYMKSCIWNAMQVGDIGIQALIKKDFG